MDLSIVIPAYNEEEALPALRRQVAEVCAGLPWSYEVILVDDGSRDRTFEVLREWHQSDPEHVRVIRFRRNFGQTAAMSAGFSLARGQIIVTLDADCQNEPGDIPLVVAKMAEGFDVVSGWRRDRKDPFWTRRLPSQMANQLISRMTGVALHDYGCTLKAYRREVLTQVRLYGEMHRFIPALASWVGGRITEVPVRHHPRRYGRSKYGLGRTFRVILDLITVKFLLSYSTRPIQIFGKIAGLFVAPALLLTAVMVGANLSYHLFGTELGADLIKRPFWVLSAFLMIVLGMQFISIGLLAEIQMRTYHESQDKPIYHVRETLPREGDE